MCANLSTKDVVVVDRVDGKSVLDALLPMQKRRRSSGSGCQMNVSERLF